MAAESAPHEDSVREYYGKDLTGTEDLATSACLVGGETDVLTRRALANVHPEVLSKFYGCGSPMPPLLGGCSVLDLGCGTGRDCYVAAQLVGSAGRVIGVDMTPEQLEVARRTLPWHMEKFGRTKASESCGGKGSRKSDGDRGTNVEFLQGNIEDLSPVADGSVDVVISNCVINLARDKRAVLREVARVLSCGGELYFSDIFADRRLPEEALKDKLLLGECLAGAMDHALFAELMADVGLASYAVVSSRPVDVQPELVARLGGAHFTSETVRAVKLPQGTTHDDKKSYKVVYRGGLLGQEHAFKWSQSLQFPIGEPIAVDPAVARSIQVSRYAGMLMISEISEDEAAHLQRRVAAMPLQSDSTAKGDGCCPPASGEPSANKGKCGGCC